MSYASIFISALGVLLASIRLGMLFISTPVFGSMRVPASAKVVLIVGLAYAMMDQVNLAGIESMSYLWLFSLVVSEALIGAAIAATLFAGFASFNVGGRILDFQAGFGLASLVDIATRNNAPLIGTLLTMTAVIIFFGLNGHWALLQVVKLSFEVAPIGSSVFSLDLSRLISYFGSCFAFGFMIVAPVVIALFLVDMGMAFMSRTMPQMNVFLTSLVIKVFVGIAVLAISIPFSGGLFKRIFESIFNTLDYMFA